MKLAIRIFYSLCFLLLSSSAAIAQDETPFHLKQANNSFYNKAYTNAIKEYLYCLKKDTSNAEATINIAECYRLTNDPVNAEIWYKKVVRLKEAQPLHQLHLGEALMQNKKYNEARKWLEEYADNNPTDNRGDEHLKTINQLNKYFRDTSFVKIEKININSAEPDFSPVIYSGGLLFTSGRKKLELVERKHAWTGSNFLSIYYAKAKDSTSFFKPKLFAPDIQTNLNNGPLCISNDERTIYFTRNNPYASSSDKVIKLEIYEGHLRSDGKNWDPLVLPFRWNSNTYSCAHPALSPDGTKLYFTSDMNLGYGGMDLYVCKKDGDVWGEPENLGPKINTQGNEAFPYIDSHGNLFFSSDGLGGLGGLDIFMSKQIDSTYSLPENLGAPFNSSRDDFGITTKGKKGFFSSNRNSSGMDDNIYWFLNNKPNDINCIITPVNSVTSRKISNIHVEIKDPVTQENIPVIEKNAILSANLTPGYAYIFEVHAENYNPKTTTLTVSTKSRNILIPLKRIKQIGNSDTQFPANICLTGIANSIQEGKKSILSNTILVIINGTTKERIAEVMTNSKGKYMFCNLPVDAELKIITGSYNYFEAATTIKTQHILYDSTIYSDLNFEKVILGKPETIDNVSFEKGQSDITAATTLALDKVVDKLRDNSEIVVELGVHTDCRGTAQDNLTLSEDRGRSLKEFIVNKGIDSRRVTYIGYGEAVLVNKCECEGDVTVPCTEQEHQKNNRVELKAIGFLKNGIIVSE